MIGIDDLLAVGLKTGNRPYDRAGGDDDVFGLDRLFLAVGQGDLDLALAGDLAKTVEDRDLVLFHQIGHTGRVFGDDVGFVFLNAAPIVAQLFYL